MCFIGCLNMICVRTCFHPKKQPRAVARAHVAKNSRPWLAPSLPAPGPLGGLFREAGWRPKQTAPPLRPGSQMPSGTGFARFGAHQVAFCACSLAQALGWRPTAWPACRAEERVKFPRAALSCPSSSRLGRVATCPASLCVDGRMDGVERFRGGLLKRTRGGVMILKKWHASNKVPHSEYSDNDE